MTLIKVISTSALDTIKKFDFCVRAYRRLAYDVFLSDFG